MALPCPQSTIKDEKFFVSPITLNADSANAHWSEKEIFSNEGLRATLGRILSVMELRHLIARIGVRLRNAIQKPAARPSNSTNANEVVKLYFSDW